MMYSSTGSPNCYQKWELKFRQETEEIMIIFIEEDVYSKKKSQFRIDTKNI